MFRDIANAADQHTSLDEFWNIANKIFVSEEDAFLFYNKYAWDKGFGVRKEKVRRSKPSGALLFRRFVCARQGERHGKWLNKEDYSRRPRALTRCGCRALIEIRFDRSRRVWYVHNFVDEHNHRMATPDEVPFLWSHRKMKDFLKSDIISMEAIGIRTHVIRDVLQCRYGEKVGCVTKDVYNFSSRHKRSRIMEGDARTVLGLMQRRQREDPDFYFDYQVDNEDRLISMFWCDTQSCMDYQSFSDVVVFDSTYRMNRYKMPFVPFVGLNHHRTTTVFGCGIVGDERAETYVWVLRAFLKAMCQQKPQSIITDGDGAMIKAIRQVLPGVNHRICCWHVEKNVPKHVPSKSLKPFRKLMYYADSAGFEERWNSFLANYQTEKNSDWLKMMYKNKELWAASFQFDKFFLGMRSNQRSESLNSSLHRHLDIYMSLVDLVEHYENCVYRLRQTEAEFDSRASQSLPVPLTKHREIEVACSHAFTPANFYLLQLELLKVDDFHIFETMVGMNSQKFMVVHKERKKALFLVDYWTSNSETKIKCSCRKMERHGLPCSHIFHIMDHLKLYEVPKCCILRRHSKAAKSGLPSRRKSSIHGWTKKRSRCSELTALGGEAFDVASRNHQEFSNVKKYLGGIISRKRSIDCDIIEGQSSNDQNDQTWHTTIGSVCDPAIAVTKGAPRKNSNGLRMQHMNGLPNKRFKSYDEKRKYKCSVCNEEGHNKQRCTNGGSR
ncbi:unnamed protein product [Urochloa humidicola]